MKKSQFSAIMMMFCVVIANTSTTIFGWCFWVVLAFIQFWAHVQNENKEIADEMNKEVK